MGATLMVHLYHHLNNAAQPTSHTTGFMEPHKSIWGLRDNLIQLLRTNQFNVQAHQPLALTHMDPERLTFHVAWAQTRFPGGADSLHNSEVLGGDVEELMAIMESRGWCDVLRVRVVYDEGFRSGLRTMTVGERAWAPIEEEYERERLAGGA